MAATLMQDLGYSLRSLRRSPALATTCVVVLALGIGANAAIFSAVKAILLDSLPYRDPERLVALYEAGVVKGDIHDEPAPANFYDWQRDSDSFDDIAAYGGISGNLSGASGRLAEHVQGVFCSWNLFRMLGAGASLGRVFTLSDDRAQSSRTIVLSHSLWRRRFEGNGAVIGHTLRLDAQVYTIIGVMPASFEFPSSTTQYWVPMQLALPAEELQTRADHRLSVIGRLKPGVPIHQSAAGLTTIQSRIARAYPGRTGTGGVETPHCPAVSAGKHPPFSHRNSGRTLAGRMADTRPCEPLCIAAPGFRYSIELDDALVRRRCCAGGWNACRGVAGRCPQRGSILARECMRLAERFSGPCARCATGAGWYR